MSERTLTIAETVNIPFRVRIYRHWDRSGYGLFIAGLKDHNTKKAFRIKHIVVEEGDADLLSMYPPDPPIFLPKETGGAQEIMDDLWDAGIRPHDYENPDKNTSHLADMRRLVDIMLPIALRTPMAGAMTLPVRRDPILDSLPRHLP